MSDAEVIERYGGTTWVRIQDRYLVAAGSSSHIVGSTGGSSTVTLTTDNLPSHSHSYTNTIVGSTTLTTNQIPSHRHGIKIADSGLVAQLPSGSFYNVELGSGSVGRYSEYSGGGGSHTHSDTAQSKTTGTAGSGTAVNIEPPYIAIYMWRRTA